MNEDYFTSPATSLFTNSSCGIFPTLSADYQIANYPVASVGLHYELQFTRWSLQASVYNGKGYYRFAGKENVFRFCPQQDGILSVTSLNYQHHDSNYHVGFALHSGMYMDYEEGTPEKTEKERRKIIWGYAEQRLAPGLHALLQGSFQSGASRGCKSYAGAGLTWQCGKQKADCSPTTPDFPLHTNGPVNLHGKSPVQTTDLYNPPYISFSKREHTI